MLFWREGSEDSTYLSNCSSDCRIKVLTSRTFQDNDNNSSYLQALVYWQFVAQHPFFHKNVRFFSDGTLNENFYTAPWNAECCNNYKTYNGFRHERVKL